MSGRGGPRRSSSSGRSASRSAARPPRPSIRPNARLPPPRWAKRRASSNKPRNRLKLTEIFLGILTAVGGFVDVSELVFMSQAGSRFGYALIWVVVLATIGIMVFGEMSGRVAAIAKQPVFNLMRHRLGLQLGLVTLVASFLSNLII